MRLLAVISHYHRLGAEPGAYGSGRLPFAKIAALNAAIVGLHRHYGPRSHPAQRAWALDIVVATAKGANLLEWIGVGPPAYEVEYYDGPPLMLPFEAQRIMRERAGGYDLYAYLEDDLIVDDPAFFEKIAWFADAFGPRSVLTPLRYEMAHTGTLARLAVDRPLPAALLAPFRKSGAPVLSGAWSGATQLFRLPDNPHSGFFAVTDAQLRLWMASGLLYDRDDSWVGPLESAATYAPAKVFDLYRATEPNPWFLAIEHFGTYYATLAAREGEVFGEPPLLAWAETAAASGAGGMPHQLIETALARKTHNMLAGENVRFRRRLDALENSRSTLAAALARAFWRKARGPRRGD